ncbi:urea ABC transporter substrate-binding protein [Streptomyces sp. TLI_146]|uniref:urea ABC transporter substrate-binding protein n=1 Tax=Streptomyces sp. TLI_146 TaxID=1938858 RepID=UPI000CADFF36|nr:urea ABC transporter substrate-binding protein [Streptomyces sp. TLI_146]PKV90083.1 urea-binding protein [Streptomyces sp. TLI_146]
MFTKRGRAGLGGPLRIGVLHSLTGPMAPNERSIVDSTMMAIEEINEEGGVLGRKIEPVVVDGASDSERFAREAERLIVEQQVQAIMGCWTSSSRKATIPVLERHEHLMFYPPTYEGLESCPYVVYTGGAPSQQVIPAVNWLLDNRGTRFFFVGSDYVWPRSAAAIIKDQLDYQGGELVGEEYRAFHETDFRSMVEKIVEARPDVIINTLAHNTLDFFRELSRAGVDPEEMPTFSLAFGEDLLSQAAPEDRVGGYGVWGYFQSIGSPKNTEFVESFRRRYGADRVTEDVCHNAYVSVRLWALAVEKAGDASPAAVRKAIKGLRYEAPQGPVWVDEENQHLWRTVRIGRIRPDRQFDIVWTSEVVIRPVPYPPYRTRRAWNELLTGLYDGWGGSWDRLPGD